MREHVVRGSLTVTSRKERVFNTGPVHLESSEVWLLTRQVWRVAIQFQFQFQFRYCGGRGTRQLQKNTPRP